MLCLFKQMFLQLQKTPTEHFSFRTGLKTIKLIQKLHDCECGLIWIISGGMSSNFGIEELGFFVTQMYSFSQTALN